MALFLTLLYVLTAYLTPGTLFGDLADFHLEIIFAALAFVACVIKMHGSGISRMNPTYGLLGLCVGIMGSIAFNGWLGGTPAALITFLPSAAAFMFVVVSCKRKIHLQMLIAVMAFSALFIVWHGFAALRENNMDSAYLYSMGNDEGQMFARARGLGFLNDPNDMGQFLLALIPLLFFFRSKSNPLLNLFVVWIPVACLVYGTYLTHSRGAMLGLMVITIVAGRRKIGTVPAIVGGLVLFVGLSAVGWSGGREISSESGSDRTDAWSAGLQMLRAHPLFGVGFERFPDNYPITAHNTIVVCAAEIGLVGFFFWVLFVFTTVRNAAVGSIDPEASRRKALKKEASGDSSTSFYSSYLSLRGVTPRFANEALHKGEVVEKEAGRRAPFALTLPWYAGDKTSREPEMGPVESFQPEEVDEVEVRRLSGLMIVSFAGYLTAGWFLSRAYAMPLFVNAGIAAAVFRMSEKQSDPPPVMSLLGAFKFAGTVSVGLIMLVYGILRTNGFLSR